MDFYVYGVPALVRKYQGVDVRVIRPAEAVDVYSPTDGEVVLLKDTDRYFAQAALSMVERGPRWSIFVMSWCSASTVWRLQIGETISPPFMVLPVGKGNWDTAGLVHAENNLKAWFSTPRAVTHELLDIVEAYPVLVTLLDLADKIRLGPVLLRLQPMLLYYLPMFACMPVVFVEAMKTWPEALRAASIEYPTPESMAAVQKAYGTRLFFPKLALPVASHPDVVMAAFRYDRAVSIFSVEQVMQVMEFFIDWWHDGYYNHLMASMAMVRLPLRVREWVFDFQTVLPMRDMTAIFSNMVTCVDTHREQMRPMLEKNKQWSNVMSKLDEIRWLRMEVVRMDADESPMHAPRIKFIKRSEKAMTKTLRETAYAFLVNLI